MPNFSLARPDIIEKLKDRDWFVDCVRQTYFSIAKKQGFVVKINNFRAYEAHDLWTDDLDKLLHHGIESSDDLEIYKYAGFLSYWLRRRLVIDSIDIYSGEAPNPQIKIKDHRDNLPKEMEEFLQFHNERSAFDFGIQMCFNYKINELKDEGFSDEDIEMFINNLARKSKQMAWDTSILMKQKSVSPHTLYLVFKSLFLH